MDEENRKAIFKRLWLEGVYEKRIVERLGIGLRTVRRWRDELDLPKRRGNRHVSVPRHPTVNVTMPESLMLAARARARNREISLSHYVQVLIRRDIGEVQ